MQNLGSSLLLLIVAIFILWLAVTGRIQALPDAWNTILYGSKDGGTTTASPASTNPVTFKLPALPVLNPSTVSI